MNRKLALWLLRNPLAAVVLIALLPLQPLFGLLCFVPGAICALFVLERGERAGTVVAVGSGLLMALTSAVLGRPAWISLALATWPLVPALLLAALLGRSASLTLVLQMAVLAGAMALVVLHLAVGDPQQLAWMRAYTQEMQDGAPAEWVDAGLVEMLVHTFWGWATLLTVLMALAGVCLARWWQSQLSQPGAFGKEFQSIQLGRVLGVASIAVLVAVLLTKNRLLADLMQLLLVALMLVGLAAVHRAVAGRKLSAGWLWTVYVTLVVPITSPFALLALSVWGFLDNWARSRLRATQPS